MAPENGMNISQIGQISIPVQDLDRAVIFYRDVLQLSLLFQVQGLAFFQCGEVRLMLALPEGNETPPKGSIIYYKVSDLQQSYATLSAHNAKLISEPHMVAKMADHDLWMCFCEDSEGNTVGLMSEVHGAH